MTIVMFLSNGGRKRAFIYDVHVKSKIYRGSFTTLLRMYLAVKYGFFY